MGWQGNGSDARSALAKRNPNLRKNTALPKMAIGSKPPRSSRRGQATIAKGFRSKCSFEHAHSQGTGPTRFGGIDGHSGGGQCLGLDWLGVGAVLFGIAWSIRRSVPSQTGWAFPGYFLFLLMGSIIPSLFCSRVAFQFINWRALTTSWLFILTISQFWEASLAIPYGWWAYEPDQMIGVFIKPHCDLPIEAVLVWTLGSWTAVIIYETILTALHAGRHGWSLFGVVRAPETELQTVKRKHQLSPHDHRPGQE
jgi:hypothetical protein